MDHHRKEVEEGGRGWWKFGEDVGEMEGGVVSIIRREEPTATVRPALVHINEGLRSGSVDEACDVWGEYGDDEEEGDAEEEDDEEEEEEEEGVELGTTTAKPTVTETGKEIPAQTPVLVEPVPPVPTSLAPPVRGPPIPAYEAPPVYEEELPVVSTAPIEHDIPTPIHVPIVYPSPEPEVVYPLPTYTNSTPHSPPKSPQVTQISPGYQQPDIITITVVLPPPAEPTTVIPPPMSTEPCETTGSTTTPVEQIPITTDAPPSPEFTVSTTPILTPTDIPPPPPPISGFPTSTLPANGTFYPPTLVPPTDTPGAPVPTTTAITTTPTEEITPAPVPPTTTAPESQPSDNPEEQLPETGSPSASPDPEEEVPTETTTSTSTSSSLPTETPATSSTTATSSSIPTETPATPSTTSTPPVATDPADFKPIPRPTFIPDPDSNLIKDGSGNDIEITPVNWMDLMGPALEMEFEESEGVGERTGGGVRRGSWGLVGGVMMIVLGGWIF